MFGSTTETAGTAGKKAAEKDLSGRLFPHKRNTVKYQSPCTKQQAAVHQLSTAGGTSFCLSSDQFTPPPKKEEKKCQLSNIPGPARESVGVRGMQRADKSAIQIWGMGEFYRRISGEEVTRTRILTRDP